MVLLLSLSLAQRGVSGMLCTARSLLSRGSPGVTQIRGTVIVERWWNVGLAKIGEEPYLHPRKHRIYRVVEDTKHSKKEKMELILTQSIRKLGSRGDTVFVEKAKGRNELLPQGLAVYPSPENKRMFEEEKKMQLAGLLTLQTQTWTGEMTVNYLKKCQLDLGVGDSVEWPLTKELVSRHLQKKLGVVVPLAALKLPDEPISTFGEYWCEVTVNGIDTVRIPIEVMTIEDMKTKRHNLWLAKQPATTSHAAGSPAGGSNAPESTAS